MKRFTFLVFLAVIGIAPTLYSQTGKLARHDRKDFSYGVKAGINAATLNDKDAEMRFGGAVGIFGMIKLGTDIGVSADILYSQQGCKLPDIGTYTELGYKLDYLNIPILANWYVPWVPGLTVKVGLQPGFLLSSELKVGEFTVNTDEDLNSIDVSIPFGISYELDFGLLFDVRYNIGVTNIVKNDTDDYLELKNSVFQITLGYRF